MDEGLVRGLLIHEMNHRCHGSCHSSPFPGRSRTSIALGCIHDKEKGLQEKSRDMGATWCAIYVAQHQWLFWPGTVVGFGSLKEDAVDKRGDPKFIFDKIGSDRYNHLPVWMLLIGFDKRIDDAHMSSSTLRITLQSWANWEIT